MTSAATPLHAVLPAAFVPPANHAPAGAATAKRIGRIAPIWTNGHWVLTSYSSRRTTLIAQKPALRAVQMALFFKSYDISAQNPWWATPSPTLDDPRLAEHIESVDHKSVSFLVRIPHTPMQGEPWFYDMSVSPNYAKTPVALLKVVDLLKGGVKPTCIFYYDFAQHSTRKSLRTVIKQYISMSKKTCGADRRYLLLDRLSRIPYWRDELKSLLIDGAFDNCTTVTFRVLDDTTQSTMDARPWFP